MNLLLIFAAAGLWFDGALGVEGGFVLLTAAIVLKVLSDLFKNHFAILQNLKLAFISGCLTLLVSDLALRIIIGNARYYRPHEMFVEHSLQFKGQYRYRPSTEYNGEGSGDLVSRASLADQDLRQVHQENFRSDELGYPNDRASAQRENCGIILGDSFAAGLGVSWQQSWVTLLQEALACPLYNLGMPGSPADELYSLTNNFSEIKLKSNPLLIWTIFTGNDITENYDALELVGRDNRLEMWQVLIQLVEEFQRRSPVREFLLTPQARSLASEIKRVRSWQGQEMLVIEAYKDSVLSDLDRVHAHQNWPKFVRTLETMQLFARTKLLRPLVFILPSKEELYLNSAIAQGQSGIAKAILIECERLALPCIDLKPKFYQAQLSDRDALWRADDTHWNERGHALMAKLVEQEIKGQTIEARMPQSDDVLEKLSP